MKKSLLPFLLPPGEYSLTLGGVPCGMEMSDNLLDLGRKVLSGWQTVEPKEGDRQ